MLFYGRIAFLCLPFTISTLAANLPPTLQLGNEGPGTGHDIAQPTSEVHCTPNTTAESLSTFSCGNAWNKIVRTTPPVIYSKRPGAGGAGDVSLPVRYLSDDGLCAIDINVVPGRRGDVSNGLSVARVADEIIRTCVPRQSISGEKVGFSPQGGLTVRIVSYNQRVTCYAPASVLLQPVPAACQQLLQEMPADDHYPVVFSRDGRTGDVKVPWMRNAESPYLSACRIYLDLFHPVMYKKVKANWYDVWAAGVAVNELCVKKNQIGVTGPIGSGNGVNGGLSFSLNRVAD